jgi:hypothetical protein
MKKIIRYWLFLNEDVMFKNIFICLLFVAFLFGCRTSELPDVYVWLQNELSGNHVSSTEKNFLVLFVSEGMCSDCINKEIININQSNFSKPILIVGVFERNRYFQSIINVISDECISLFINTEKYIPKRLPLQPFYSVFDYQTKTVTRIFYPQPCEPQETLQYLREVDTELAKS